MKSYLEGQSYHVLSDLRQIQLREQSYLVLSDLRQIQPMEGMQVTQYANETNRTRLIVHVRCAAGPHASRNHFRIGPGP